MQRIYTTTVANTNPITNVIAGFVGRLMRHALLGVKALLSCAQACRRCICFSTKPSSDRDDRARGLERGRHLVLAVLAKSRHRSDWLPAMEFVSIDRG